MKRDYLITHQSDLGHYTAEAFTLRCFDDRFWKIFKHFLKKTGIQRIDPESVAGGAKILASPEKESDRDFMLREIEKSAKLHGTTRILLFTHHDCGAYGGFNRFNNDPQAEFDFHAEEHKKARDTVQARFPQLAIESYFLDAEGIIRMS